MNIAALSSGYNKNQNNKLSFGCRMMAFVKATPTTKEDDQIRTDLLYNNPQSLKNESAPGLDYRDGCSNAYNEEDLFGYYKREGNPHGWGIVSYVSKGQNQPKKPQTFKSELPAYKDWGYYNAVNTLNYTKPSITLAHVRLAVGSKVDKQNAHPFTYKNWAFEHNGSVDGTANKEVKELVNGKYAKLLGDKPKGTTDSETAFYYFLGRMKESYGTTDSKEIGLDKTRKMFAKSMVELIDKSSEHHFDMDGSIMGLKGKLDLSPACDVIASDGDNVFAFKKGHTLYLGESKNSKNESQYIIASEKPCKTNSASPVKWLAIPEEHILTISKNKEGKLEKDIYSIKDLVPEYNELSEKAPALRLKK